MSTSLVRHAAAPTYSSSFSALVTSKDDRSNVRRLRLLKRQRVKLAALAETGQGHVAVEIKNISQSGAGFLTTVHMEINEEIVFHLPGGRALKAHVRWRRLGFCGAEFESRLSEGDPILPPLEPGDQAHTARAPERKSEPSAGSLQRIVTARKRAKRAFGARMGRLQTWFKTRSIWRELRRHQRMIEKACRKQGFAWLAELKDLP